jgi:uncharacterized protein (TIGR02246 family)
MVTMKNAVIGALLLCLSACAAPTGPTPLDPAALKTAIEANNTAWAAAANKGDAAAVAAMYTENATMLPPGMDIQQGRAAVQQTVERLGKAGIRNVSFTALDVAQVGPDTAREIGKFSLEARGPKNKWLTEEGKYVVVWKLVNGKWLLDVDIWNTNK